MLNNDLNDEKLILFLYIGTLDVIINGLSPYVYRTQLQHSHLANNRELYVAKTTKLLLAWK